MPITLDITVRNLTQAQALKLIDAVGAIEGCAPGDARAVEEVVATDGKKQVTATAVRTEAAPSKPAGGPQPAPAKKPTPPAQTQARLPVGGDDDEDDDAPAPATKKPTPAAKPPAGKPAAAKKPEPEPEDEEDEAQADDDGDEPGSDEEDDEGFDPASVPQAVLKAAKLADVVAYLHGKGGMKTRDEIKDACRKLKKAGSALSLVKVMDVDTRVEAICQGMDID